MDGIVEVQRRLSIEFETSDFTVNLNDGPFAGQEVPHVHFHIIPRLAEGTRRPMWKQSQDSSEPDFAMLAELAERLQAH